MKIVIDIPDYDLDNIQNGSIACGQVLKAVKNGKPYEETQRKFTDLEQEVTADAINYLLGAELLEENGYTEEVINALKSVLRKIGAEEDY